MALTADTILKRANITLQDDGYVRWTLPELMLYLNDAMNELALHKPNAVTQTVELPLAEGTLQTIADEYISLIRVTRNLETLSASPSGRTGGKAITITSRGTLDVVMPDWQNPNVLPYADDVEHVIQDMADPRSFYVIPGNTGNGTIEAVMAVLPTELAVASNDSGLALEHYTTLELEGIPAVFKNALTDYVLFRAYSKDTADQASAARATAHYNLFAGAIGLKVQSDKSANVKTTKATS